MAPADDPFGQGHPALRGEGPDWFGRHFARTRHLSRANSVAQGRAQFAHAVVAGVWTWWMRWQVAEGIAYHVGFC